MKVVQQNSFKFNISSSDSDNATNHFTSHGHGLVASYFDSDDSLHDDHSCLSEMFRNARIGTHTFVPKVYLCEPLVGGDASLWPLSR